MANKTAICEVLIRRMGDIRIPFEAWKIKGILMMLSAALLTSMIGIACSASDVDNSEGGAVTEAGRSAETKNVDPTEFGEAFTSSGLSLPSSESSQPDIWADALLCDRREGGFPFPKQAKCPYFTELSGLMLPMLESNFGVSLTHGPSVVADTGETYDYLKGTVKAHVTLPVIEGNIDLDTIDQDLVDFVEIDMRAANFGGGSRAIIFGRWSPGSRNEELGGSIQYDRKRFEISVHYKLPDVQGSKEFTQQTRTALHLLKTDAPGIYTGVVRSVDIIKEATAGSGMDVASKTYNVGQETAFATGLPRDLQIVWYASTIAHDANHSQRFLRSVAEYRISTRSEISNYEYNNEVYYRRILPATVWREKSGEIFALTAQIETLKLIDDGAKVINALKNFGISEQSVNLPLGGSGSSEAWFATRSDKAWQEYLTSLCGSRRPCSFEMNLQKKLDDPEADPYWKSPPCEEVVPGEDCRHW